MMSDVSVYAQGVVQLPAAGTRLALSPAFAPPLLKGIKVYRNDPFRFDFILDKGDAAVADGQVKTDSTRLIKYFLASITVPQKDLWVNLSPYEKDRIVPEAFGQTEMGRDLLAQDYILKQITASVIYPDEKTGKEFWGKVYAEALRRYGTTDVPVDTLNKVWIIPEKATVYENKDAAFVVESRLKVMLEEDYLALEKDSVVTGQGQNAPATNKLGSEIVREVVIPILEKEVNEGKNFAPLRQVYNSLILATWYKRKVKAGIMGQAYVGRKKTGGIDIADKNEKEKIWLQYVEAFKKGAYDLVREEYDAATQETIPRKYFSGGFDASQFQPAVTADSATLPQTDARDIVIEMKGSLITEDPSQSDGTFSPDVVRPAIMKLVETAARPKALRQIRIVSDQVPVLMEWFFSEGLMPDAALLKQLLYNIYFQYTQGDKHVADGWLSLMAQKWGVPKENLSRLMLWLRKNKTFETEVSGLNLYAFMQAVVMSYRQFPDLRKTFVYNLPPGLSGDMQLHLATENVNRMLGLSSADFVGAETVLKAPIEGTPYFIGLQYGLAESTHGLYLVVGREMNLQDPLVGTFFRIGLDSQEDSLRVIMVQGVRGAGKEINEIFPGMLGLHPGVALLYVAAALAAQGHLRYNKDGFDGSRKDPFRHFSGIKPEFIPTMKNGTPSVEIMISYARFGLRKSTDYDRWQETSYLLEKLIPARVKMGGAKAKGIVAMMGAFQRLKPIAVKIANIEDDFEHQGAAGGPLAEAVIKPDVQGGIDLDPARIDMAAKSGGEEIQFNFDPAMLQRLQDASGVTPVIVGIHSLGSLQQFLEIH